MGAKRLSAAFAGCLVVAGCGAGRPAEDTASLDLLEATRAVVAQVTDGDTLRLRDGRRVRLVQVDAPEVRECFHRAATRALARRAPPGAHILLARDPALDDRDEHGRLLRYVLDDDRLVNVNVELVREGAAAPYFFRGARGAFATELLDAATDARRERRGLWGACPAATFDPHRGSLSGRA